VSRGPDSGGTRVVFFGSGTFALPILDALRALPNVHVVAVVSAPDRPAGRGQSARSTPVTSAARDADLPVLQPARLREAAAFADIAALHVDLGVLADYGRIVPPAVLELPARGFINVHPSLLPRHRGASPIPAAILANDPETGVSIIEMGAGIDDGPVVAQAAHVLKGDEVAPALEGQLAALGAELLGRTLGPWLDGSLTAVPQDDDVATLTRPLRREDGRLDPALAASALERRVRAYAPWPGSYVETTAGRLNVDAATVRPARQGDAAGTLVAEGDGLALTTADGRLRLDDVRLAGTRPMSGAELRRGRPALVGMAVRTADTALTAPPGAL
jgi:methionyl-tRNA formyltransferase